MRSRSLSLLPLLCTAALSSGLLPLPAAHADEPVTELTASEALDRMDRGRLSSLEYVNTLLNRADHLQGLNVFISRREREDVLTEAFWSDVRRFLGFRCGRLEGLPIIVKDNIDSADLPTTAGTPALFSNRPARNAAVLDRLLAEGAILIGKANMHELAFGTTCNNPATGAVHNPYDVTKIPGGSSGGTAAAIAARIVPFGLGTDTAGSVRVPSALSGTYGFHPSAGRYSRDGIVLISNTQDRVGTMARSVNDLVLLDRVLSDQGSHIPAVPLRGLRLGVDRANFVSNVDPSVSVLFEAALVKLQKRGVTVVDISIMPPTDFQNTINALRFSVGFYEAPINLARYLQGVQPPLTVQQVANQIASPDVRGIFFNFLVPGAPLAVSPQTYQAGLAARANLRSAYATAVQNQRLDGVIFPTTLLPARPIGQDVTVDLNGRQFPTTLIYSQNVVPGSYAGLAGLSLPIGLTDTGLPVGLELDGLEGSDEAVLGIGLSLEKVFGHLPAPQLP
ncbi:MAG: indoleacetamide hydrolase [Chthonomonadales bacterium]|nr:indoleacetamide hydrolase [Chthonomonadales bacterium]